MCNLGLTFEFHAIDERMDAEVAISIVELKKDLCDFKRNFVFVAVVVIGQDKR